MKRFLNTIKSSKVYIFSVIFITVLMLISLLAPMLPIDPTKTNISSLSQGPSLQYLFGTDEVGRDYFARVVYGGQVSLKVGLLAMITSVIIGTTIGLIAGYLGGWIDNLLMRIVDVLSSIPWLVLVIVLSVFLKPGLTSIVIVIGCFSWIRLARLIRAETLSAKEYDYVVYSKFTGVKATTILKRHILPAIIPTLVVAASSSIANAIMTEAALSFLGLGIQQPMTSWGTLLQNAQQSLQSAPHMAIIPGLFVMLTIYSFNNIGNLVTQYVQREGE